MPPIEWHDEDETVALLRDAAQAVMNELGKGHSEAIYQAALEVELRFRKVDYETQPILPVLYKGQRVGFVKPDLMVRKRVVVELKAYGGARISGRDQIKRYLRCCEGETTLQGVLVNFCENPVLFHLFEGAS